MNGVREKRWKRKGGKREGEIRRVRRTVSPYLRDLNSWLRGHDRRKWWFLQLRFDEEPPCIVERRELPRSGNVGGIGRSGPLATPVVDVVGNGAVGLSLAEGGGGDENRSCGD